MSDPVDEIARRMASWYGEPDAPDEDEALTAEPDEDDDDEASADRTEAGGPETPDLDDDDDFVGDDSDADEVQSQSFWASLSPSLRERALQDKRLQADLWAAFQSSATGEDARRPHDPLSGRPLPLDVVANRVKSLADIPGAKVLSEDPLRARR